MSADFEHRSPVDKRLDRFFSALLGGVPSSDIELRDQVISLMFRWRVGVPVSVISSCILAIGAMILIGAMWARVWMALDITLGVARWRLASAQGLVTSTSRFRTAGWMALLGLVWSIMLGVAAALCALSGDMTLTILAVSIIAGTVGIVSFRNAPTPRCARLMIIALVGPLALTGALANDGPLLVITLLIVPWCLLLFALLRQNFDVLCTLARLRLHLYEVARTDTLTGLSNRLLFGESVDELETMARGSTACIACLDLDGFKQVNDRYGHDAGDHLLQTVADRLRASVRRDDKVFRLGGDEFAIIMYNTPLDEADRIIDRLIAEVGREYDMGLGMTARVGVSVGSAECIGGESDVTELLRAADRALYRAKEEGRGRNVHVMT
ncbi:MAG TPA: GGDEF domain-containing protein [Croceibacterium sp.]|nr:GGDEF domain-containing protein [Croceibacterium sp.]